MNELCAWYPKIDLIFPLCQNDKEEASERGAFPLPPKLHILKSVRAGCIALTSDAFHIQESAGTGCIFRVIGNFVLIKSGFFVGMAGNSGVQSFLGKV